MKPALSEILLTSAHTLATGVAPHLADKPYALGHTGTIGLMLVFLAQEAERAVETLAADNAEMRALFAQALSAPLPTELRQAVERAAQSSDRGLHVRTLEADNATLRAVLIALHEAADDAIAPWARALQTGIWAHLKASADRRALVLPGA